MNRFIYSLVILLLFASNCIAYHTVTRPSPAGAVTNITGNASVTGNMISADLLLKAFNPSHLRISLITCGPGYNEIYEVFGHTAIRIVDSEHHTDLVYNYGTFNGFEENFELKFMRGKLPYYLSVYPFSNFIPEYIETHRSVSEQVLDMTNQQKKSFAAYLDNNAEPENRSYKYDFFYDNCATRIRDLFPSTMGRDFKFAPILPKNSRLTFRDIINQYFYATKWERFGINILLGSKIDKVMTDKDIMFLPDYLSKGLDSATVKAQVLIKPGDISTLSSQLLTSLYKTVDHPIAGHQQQLIAGGPAAPDRLSGPMVMTMCIALLTILGLSVPKLRWLGHLMTVSLLVITALLGCLIIVMWFFTDHQGCANNYNILWLLPTNLLMAFPRFKGRGRYALIAIVFVFTTIVLHIAGIQQLILSEFAPLLLALVYIYGTIYKNSNTKLQAS